MKTIKYQTLILTVLLFEKDKVSLKYQDISNLCGQIALKTEIFKLRAKKGEINPNDIHQDGSWKSIFSRSYQEFKNKNLIVDEILDGPEKFFKFNYASFLQTIISGLDIFLPFDEFFSFIRSLKFVYDSPEIFYLKIKTNLEKILHLDDKVIYAFIFNELIGSYSFIKRNSVPFKLNKYENQFDEGKEDLQRKLELYDEKVLWLDYEDHFLLACKLFKILYTLEEQGIIPENTSDFQIDEFVFYDNTEFDFGEPLLHVNFPSLSNLIAEANDDVSNVEIYKDFDFFFDFDLEFFGYTDEGFSNQISKLSEAIIDMDKFIELIIISIKNILYDPMDYVDLDDLVLSMTKHISRKITEESQIKELIKDYLEEYIRPQLKPLKNDSVFFRNYIKHEIYFPNLIESQKLFIFGNNETLKIILSSEEKCVKGILINKSQSLNYKFIACLLLQSILSDYFIDESNLLNQIPSIESNELELRDIENHNLILSQKFYSRFPEYFITLIESMYFHFYFKTLIIPKYPNIVESMEEINQFNELFNPFEKSSIANFDVHDWMRFEHDYKDIFMRIFILLNKNLSFYSEIDKYFENIELNTTNDIMNNLPRFLKSHYYFQLTELNFNQF